MNLRRHARTLAMASILALAVVGLPAAPRVGACSLTVAACRITLPVSATPVGNLQFWPVQTPNLRVQIVSTPLDCKYYAGDPDVCSVQYFTVNIRVSNDGVASSPATQLWWQFGPSATYPPLGGSNEDTRSVPSLAAGQGENDSWPVVPANATSALPPGTCKTLAIWLNPQGGNVNALLINGAPPSAQTQVCNTVG